MRVFYFIAFKASWIVLITSIFVKRSLQTCIWLAVPVSSCPCTEWNTYKCDLAECTSSMAAGEFCEADQALPDGNSYYEIDQCPGTYDIFEKTCHICNRPSVTGYDLTDCPSQIGRETWNPSCGSCSVGYTGSVTHTECSIAGTEWSVSGCEASCNKPTVTGYDLTACPSVATRTNWNPSCGICSVGYTGSVTHTVCSPIGSEWAVSGCQAGCNRPTLTTLTGYDLADCSSTIARAGWNPSCGSCGAGYTGSVTHTVCGSVGTEWSVSGCQPTCNAYPCPDASVVQNSASTTYTETNCCFACSWLAVPVSSCPCTESDNSGCNLPECTSSMADGELCEADQALPDGNSNYHVDQCPGTYDIFEKTCQSCSRPSVTGYDLTDCPSILAQTNWNPSCGSCSVGYTGSVVHTVCGSVGTEWSVSGCQPSCNQPDVTGYDLADCSSTIVRAGWNPSCGSCSVGYIGSVTHTVCSSLGTEWSVSGCQASCYKPNVAGYDLANCTYVIAQVGWNPSCGSCDAGFVGLVRHTVCDSSGTTWSVSGCLRTTTTNTTTTNTTTTYAQTKTSINASATTNVTTITIKTITTTNTSTTTTTFNTSTTTNATTTSVRTTTTTNRSTTTTTSNTSTTTNATTIRSELAEAIATTNISSITNSTTTTPRGTTTTNTSASANVTTSTIQMTRTTNTSTSTNATTTTKQVVNIYRGSLSLTAANLTEVQVTVSARKTLALEFRVDETQVTVSVEEKPGISRRLAGEARRLAGTWNVAFSIAVPSSQIAAGESQAADIGSFHTTLDATAFQQSFETHLQALGVNPQAANIQITNYGAVRLATCSSYPCPSYSVNQNLDSIDFSQGNCCQARCTVPIISVGVQSWIGAGCGSGSSIVVEGTTCTINSASDYICTSPGTCGSDGNFATNALCQALCTVPSISGGAQSWNGANCNSGSSNVVEGTVCEVIQSNGYICTSPGLCEPDGSFANTASCEACTPGKFSDLQDASQCRDCEPGTWTDAFGASACKQCPAGRYSNSPGLTTNCVACGIGRWSSVASSTECRKCVAGKYGPSVQQTSDTCIECSSGRYGIEEGLAIDDQCARCVPGKYSSGTGASTISTCIDCDRGKYQDLLGSDACKSCTSGRFQATTGNTECSECAKGTYGPTMGLSECIGCATGRYSAALGAISIDTCRECAAGTVGPTIGLSECSSCSYGSATTDPGQSVCTPCPNHGQDDWPAQQTLEAPPGKTEGLRMHELPSCEKRDIALLGVEDSALIVGANVLPNIAYLGLAADRDTQNCKKFSCAQSACELTIDLPQFDLAVGEEVFVRAVLLGQMDHICPDAVTLQMVPFGCAQGTISQFLYVLSIVLFGTVFVGLVAEACLKTRIETHIEGRLEVHLPRGELDMIDLMHETRIEELHSDICNGLKQPKHRVPLKTFEAWLSTDIAGATCVHIQFAVKVPPPAWYACREWFGRGSRQKIRALKRDVERSAWAPSAKWKDAVVKTQSAGVVKVAGRMLGFELMSIVEKSLPCMRRNPEWDNIHQKLSKHLLEHVLCCRAIGFLIIQYTLNFVVAGLIPAYASSMMADSGCEAGYPMSLHIVWAVFCLLSVLSNLYVIKRWGGPEANRFMWKAKVNLICRMGFAFLNMTDIYQDATFPVIAKTCKFDLWMVSAWLVILGCFLMQFVNQLITLGRRWWAYRRAKTPEDKLRLRVEGVFLLARAADNVAICYALRPAVEEELGGESSWSMKMAEARVPFFRFFFEDVEQGVLQFTFIMFFASAKDEDKAFIFLSIATSICNTCVMVIQVLPEMRDWLWYRFLASIPILHRFKLGRLLAIVILFAFYRVIATFPWLMACSHPMLADIVWELMPNGWTRVRHLRKVVLDEIVEGLIISLVVFVGVVLLVVFCKLLGNFQAKLRSLAIEDPKPITLEQSMLRLKARPLQGIEYLSQDYAENTFLGPLQELTDPWLQHARKMYSAKAEHAGAIERLDQALYSYSMPRISKRLRRKLNRRIRGEMNELATYQDSAELGADCKDLLASAERVHYIISLRVRTQSLLKDKTFIRGGLKYKGKRIAEAIDLDRSYYTLDCLCRHQRFSRSRKRTLRKEHSFDDTMLDEANNLDFFLLHWQQLKDRKQIPRFDRAKNLRRAGEAFEESKAKQKIAVAVFFSHPWLLPAERKPDNEKNIKAKKLVEFASWYAKFCKKNTGMDIDVWYWIDYACVDQDKPQAGIALLPTFIAACDVVLTWQTPDFDRRCWTMVERMLSYSFCPAGMTPYCINETFNGPNDTEDTDREDEDQDTDLEITNAVTIDSVKKWQVKKDGQWICLDADDTQKELTSHYTTGYKAYEFSWEDEQYVANFDELRLHIKGREEKTYAMKYARVATVKARSSRTIRTKTGARKPLHEPIRRPRKLIYPLDLDACTLTNFADVQHVRLLTELALSLPAFEVFADRQSVEWGLTEVIEQSLIERKQIANSTERSFKKSRYFDQKHWLVLGDASSADPLIQIMPVKQAAQMAGGGMLESNGRILLVASADALDCRETHAIAIARAPLGPDDEEGVARDREATIDVVIDDDASREYPERGAEQDTIVTLRGDIGRWQVELSPDEWTNYDSDANERLQHHFLRGDRECSLTIRGAQYLVSFDRSVQFNTETKMERLIRYMTDPPPDLAGPVPSQPSRPISLPAIPDAVYDEGVIPMQWQVQIDSGAWQNYDQHVNKQLEDARLASKDVITVSLGKFSYDIDVVRRVQINTATKKERPVRLEAMKIDRGSSSTTRPPDLGGSSMREIIDVDRYSPKIEVPHFVDPVPHFVDPDVVQEISFTPEDEIRVGRVKEYLRSGIDDADVREASIVIGTRAVNVLKRVLGSATLSSELRSLKNAIQYSEMARVEVPLLREAIEKMCKLQLREAVKHARNQGLSGPSSSGDDHTMLADAMRTAARYGMDHLSDYRIAKVERERVYRAVLPVKLQEAKRIARETDDPKLVIHAWKVAKEYDIKDEALQAAAEDAEETLRTREKALADLRLPASWDAKHADDLALKNVKDDAFLKKIQELMDKTFNAWHPAGFGARTKTRDRKRLADLKYEARVPKRLIVHDITRVENIVNYVNYRTRKDTLKKFLAEKKAAGESLWPEVASAPCEKVRTSQVNLHEGISERAFKTALNISPSDIVDCRNSLGANFSSLASEAESWIARQNRGSECLEHLKSAAEGNDDRYRASVLVLQDGSEDHQLKLDNEINEVYLWHGTTPNGAEAIAKADFDMDRAGKSVGALLGTGLYFAESCLKADEYAIPQVGPDGTTVHPLVLARVILGRPNLCRAARPNAEELKRSCLQTGAMYESVLGDREFVNKTFREFVIFDNKQVYPEYIIWYKKEEFWD